ncbi:MAG TPA: Nif3-like dinuclear metal center hexameric protein [Solirubrobacteraceae bacterium]|nr:Nif3-like dinuclear metal center hexameric protein [Solirubrobacteraceae bacterium]
MAPLPDIIEALDELLGAASFEDYGPNGLQVPGRPEVNRVVTGVTAHAELFELAARESADLVLVHHGILWDSGPRTIDASLKRRLKLLLDHDMSLAAYHLPLDAHPQVGNNALIAERLGCQERVPFGEHRGQALGCQGSWTDGGVEAEVLLGRIEELTGRRPLVFACGPERVRSVGIVSGAGAQWLEEAIAKGLDAFLTGEPAERVMSQAREAEIHFIAAGHYATETFGIRALGEHLEARFGVRHSFIDVPNPI